MGVEYGSLPFGEAIQYLRAKLHLPTQHWDDIRGQEHDRYWMVAGAQKADLLADLHADVMAAIAEGISIQTFRQRFEATAQRHGWTDYTGAATEAGRDWRARTVYSWNLRTSHAAGRLAQMRALVDARPYWRYVHADGVAHPRPLHLAWHGTVLPAGDPWWATHYGPNGPGCRCRVESLAQRDVDRLGITVGPAPDDGTYTYIDRQGEVHTLPQGIAYGWDHQPGRLRDLRAELEAKADRLPKPIGDALRKDLARSDTTER